jgi:putative Mg2+ transporter-C (MgtC) family protein
VGVQEIAATGIQAEIEIQRILGAVVTGVSFLRAGTILRRGRGRQVEGLTMADSLQVAATVSMCAALSRWVLAVGATLLALTTLRGVGLLERWLDRRHSFG